MTWIEKKEIENQMNDVFLPQITTLIMEYAHLPIWEEKDTWDFNNLETKNDIYEINDDGWVDDTFILPFFYENGAEVSEYELHQRWDIVKREKDEIILQSRSYHDYNEDENVDGRFVFTMIFNKKGNELYDVYFRVHLP